MRRYDEPIAVRSRVREDALDAGLGPDQFVWRGRLWRVLDVERRWCETVDWWSDPADDLLGERQVWRVRAACGAGREPAVCELAHAGAGDDGWMLRGVMD